MYLKKSILYLLIFALTISLTSNMAYGTGDINNKLKNVKSEINDIKSNISDKKNNLSKINENIIQLNKEIGATEAQIININSKISSTNKKILELKEQQEENEENIVLLEENLAGRIKSMSRLNEMTYIKIIISSNDVKDFLSTMNIMRKIVNQDKENIGELKEEKQKLKNISTELKKEEQSLKNLKSEYDIKFDSLNSKKKTQNENMAVLETDIKSLEQMEKLKVAESNALISQIQQMTSSSGYQGKYNGIMKWPVSGGGEITSYYGNRIHPILKYEVFHSGVDIAANMGVPVLAASEGKVIFSGDKGTYGRTVIIDHGNGITTLYGHNSALYVTTGQTVSSGQKIAAIGSTGRSTGPHLHFEVRENGITKNPLAYIQ